MQGPALLGHVQALPEIIAVAVRAIHTRPVRIWYLLAHLIHQDLPPRLAAGRRCAVARLVAAHQHHPRRTGRMGAGQGMLHAPAQQVGNLVNLAATAGAAAQRIFEIIDTPVEIEEAAIVDGATPWIIITKVFLPLLWPALVTTGLLAFIGAWNEFLFALTFTSSETTRTVPVAIGLLSGASQQEIPWGPIMAASVIVTVPLVILVLVFQRKIVAGLTAGGVKG